MTDDPQDPSEKDSAETETPKAKDELFEAIDHFKKAATILFDKATSDPTVKSATDEAERVIKKLGDTAEPLAKQLTSELGKLTKKISDVVSETAAGSKKKSSPPPGDDQG
jgi:hypothetical protein